MPKKKHTPKALTEEWQAKHGKYWAIQNQCSTCGIDLMDVKEHGKDKTVKQIDHQRFSASKSFIEYPDHQCKQEDIDGIYRE